MTVVGKFLGDAYAAKIMGMGSIASSHLQLLMQHQADSKLIDELRAEYARCVSVPREQCFASAIHVAVLRDAIAFLEANPTQVAIPTSQQEEDDNMTSKLKGLAGLAKSTIAEVEGRATSAMDKLAKAQAHAHSGLDKVDGVTAEIEKAASDMEDFANQVTNGPPTE